MNRSNAVNHFLQILELVLKAIMVVFTIYCIYLISNKYREDHEQIHTDLNHLIEIYDQMNSSKIDPPEIIDESSK